MAGCGRSGVGLHEVMRRWRGSGVEREREREREDQLECSKRDALMVHYSSYMQW